MTGERLTRQELTWLLTQEAKSAADRLRHEVGHLGVPEAEAASSARPIVFAPALDALDDAMKALSSLHKGGAPRGRRGRIDVASILWEVAPTARVSIEPGSGTEVFGDESELRRMLQVLVHAASPTSMDGGMPEVALQRDGADVRIAVSLGPESSPMSSLERAWLERMAIRYGGRVSVESNSISVAMPADGSSDRQEVEMLRRELVAAQEQGEAYARELAAVFTAQVEGFASIPPPPSTGDATAVLGALATGVAAPLRALLGALGRELATLRAQGPAGVAAADAVAPWVAIGADLCADVSRYGELAIDEGDVELDLASAVGAAVREARPRAHRAGVSLAVEAPPEAILVTRPSRATLLVRALLDHAISATPRGGEVRARLTIAPDRARLAIDDDGARVPGAARLALLAGMIDPVPLGRPLGIALVAAATLARGLGGSIVLADGVRGVETVAELPRNPP